MKKRLLGLFYLVAFCVASSATSCSNDNSVETKESYRAFDNHVKLEGEGNMRDLGGFAAENGKRILYRKLFSSGQLSALTPADKDSLVGLGIKQIIDLRSENDRNDRPDVAIDGVAYSQLPLWTVPPGESSETMIMFKIAQGKLNARDVMFPVYTTFNELREANWEKIFDILETGNVTLWHCNTGKDGAAMTRALVLSALGVDKTTIIKDYVASNIYMFAYNQSKIKPYISRFGKANCDNLLPFLNVEDSYIISFFDAIDSKYGSMNNFLEKIKVDKVKLRNLYLEK